MNFAIKRDVEGSSQLSHSLAPGSKQEARESRHNETERHDHYFVLISTSLLHNLNKSKKENNNGK
jgi:hypothetical protein